MDYQPAPRWLELPGLYDEVQPAVFGEHVVRWRNQRAAASVGLDTLHDEGWTAHFGRFEPLPDNLQTPLALRYHGHQFGHYNPQLGDGRGFLFAQLRDDTGRLMDLGTKGTGQTPWSRGGDGRLTLQGAVREVLAAELLEARGVPTCRILSVVETGEQLIRHDEPSPTRAAAMVRLSHGHVRVGTFQRLQWFRDTDGIEALVRYCTTHLVPEAEPPPLGLFRATGSRLMDTAAAWMAAGFVHGVLNTDNLSITGESFDYGPWRFNPTWDPSFVAAYFDHSGMYAFGQQVQAVGHGLVRLAGALGMVGDGPAMQGVLDELAASWPNRLHAAVLGRLGVVATGSDGQLADAFIAFASEGSVPLHLLFADWSGGALVADTAMSGPRRSIYRARAFGPVRRALVGYEPTEPIRGGQEGLLIEQVRSIWDDIASDDDWTQFNAAVARIRGPVTVT
jgi:uncharacterized protein YdiU (UPF0061 family)